MKQRVNSTLVTFEGVTRALEAATAQLSKDQELAVRMLLLLLLLLLLLPLAMLLEMPLMLVSLLVLLPIQRLSHAKQHVAYISCAHSL